MSPRFTSPPDPIGFNHQVWLIVRQIPSRKVATYGQIASLIPLPPGVPPNDYRTWGARWVGSAMADCPENVPWHRVINAQGKISPRRSGGEMTQRQLLEQEGIVFDERERIDLKKFGWSGVETG